MEIIRKKICIDRYRSKRQGLLPYIPYGEDVTKSATKFHEITESDYNGNFGGFVCDVSGDTSSYHNEIYKYNKIIKELHAGKKLFRNGEYWVEKHVDNLSIYSYDKIVALSDFTECNSKQYKTDKTISGNSVIAVKDDSILGLESNLITFCQKMDTYIGKIMVPTTISGGYVTESISLVDVPAMKENMTRLKQSTECCDIRKYVMNGGDAMLNFLNSINFEEYIPSVNPLVPYITMPIMLVSKFDDLGVMKTHEYMAELINVSADTYTTSVSGVVESKLNTLRTQQYYYDDFGNVLPGLFVENRDSAGNPMGIYYKWQSNGSGGKWTEIVPGSGTNLSLCEPYVIRASMPEDNGVDSVVSNYAMVWHLNDNDANVMQIPYKVNVPFNIVDTGKLYGVYEIMKGDYINEINISGNTIEFIYTIGGEYYINTFATPDEFVALSGSGVKYREIYPYYPKEEMKVTLDGKKDVTIYYNKIDFDVKKVKVKHLDFDAEREILQAEIIGQNTNWPFCAIGEAYDNAPIYKEDFMMASTFDYRTSVDIEVTRGNAGAFEKHLKLSECNTMQDLKNYTNNFFNT